MIPKVFRPNPKLPKRIVTTTSHIRVIDRFVKVVTRNDERIVQVRVQVELINKQGQRVVRTFQEEPK